MTCRVGRDTETYILTDDKTDMFQNPHLCPYTNNKDDLEEEVYCAEDDKPIKVCIIGITGVLIYLGDDGMPGGHQVHQDQ